jgi:hypothetical protein
MKFELKFSDLRFWVLTYFVHWDNASHIEAMQSSQDEEYPWIDNNDNDGPSSHHAEAEWDQPLHKLHNRKRENP